MTAIYDDEDKGVANSYDADNIFLCEYSENGEWQYIILVREGKGRSGQYCFMEIHTNSSPIGGKMKRQIYMEYRKMWNKITGVAVLAMCAVVILHLFIYLNLQYRAIERRQIVEG